MSPARTSSLLNEQIIQDSFHSYLRSSLAQAKAERLLDEDILSSAQGDLMITGTHCISHSASGCNPTRYVKVQLYVSILLL